MRCTTRAVGSEYRSKSFGQRTMAAGLELADTTMRFAPPAEVLTDLLLAEGKQGPWVIVEVQLVIDAVKQRKWLLAASVLFDARGVMGDLVVITSQPHVAQWAATVARGTGPLGTQLGLSPVVVLLSGEQTDALLDEATRAQLDGWSARAAVASSLADVFTQS